MNRKSKDTIYEVGEIYMSGMNEQMSGILKMLFSRAFPRLEGLFLWFQFKTKRTCKDELVYRAKVREFDYLALCSDEGVFETLWGRRFSPSIRRPLCNLLKQGERRVAVGVDEAGNDVVLFGVQADYPMKSGEKKHWPHRGGATEYITNFLSLGEEGRLMYYHIIRPDGALSSAIPTASCGSTLTVCSKFRPEQTRSLWMTPWRHSALRSKRIERIRRHWR